ncbi:hypothetical protein [Spiroplasma platyhelix]|uniref:DUF1146 domain-containing protein n=1 Tax=Spiroplasma platyhelix PALS-1 TaxID=1276218 RepID=A0A846U575_9MOLU|nr:hypothetical protein [Spiroplasma platyhelix]MBE4704234.1 hypothetical protein [Spiroplasma platyhelix PALS-1]NKE38607.1 hypothetical protein [Spiroplasma platyhelix PALS-1]UJB28818.1 hypothetical protein SPLAT_v1c00510 [Spiroplasma platyhelix PALS-1]
MDSSLLRWGIELTVYLLSFIVSAIAVKAIPFNKFLDHSKVKEAWILYLLTVLALTFCIGSLITKFIGIDIWLPVKN